MSPPEVASESHAIERPFDGVEERSTVDHLIRLVQQHHVQLSAMADTKANIIITVSSIVLTLVLGRVTDPDLRTGRHRRPQLLPQRHPALGPLRKIALDRNG